MSATRLGRIQKATTILPLVLLSAAWTASLTGIGPTAVTSAASSPEPEGSLPGGATVPAQAIEAPASLSSPEEITPGFEGTDAEIEQIVATSSTNGIPAAALSAYQRAEAVINAADKSCNLTWQLIAAIGRVETDHGRFGGNVLNAKGVATPGIYGLPLNGKNNTALIRDTDAGQYDNDTAFDRAVGPMQFIPSTWSVVGVDADGDGQRNPQDIDDASLGTAVYLCSGSDDLSTLGGQRAAVYRYNHSDSYVALVLSIADNYLQGDFTAVPNNTSAAGFLNPLPGFTPSGAQNSGPSSPTRTPNSNGNGNGGPGGGVTTSPDNSGSTPPTTPPTDPQNPTSPTDDGPQVPAPENGGGTVPPIKIPPIKVPPIKLPPIKVPPIKVPPLPDTGVDPVDDLLTTAQALVQCTLDGLINNPLSSTDRYDQCVKDYTTK